MEMEQDVMTAAPVIERRKLDVVRRTLTVKALDRLSIGMMRVVLTGDELDGFNSPSPDDHVKVFFPVADGEPAKRDYTPRRYDAEARTLAIDFVLHEGGVGAAWAEAARVGDTLEIGGPRGSTVVDARWWLLVGDETALPSVGRRLEEMAAGKRVVAVLTVTGQDAEQVFETKANVTMHWIHRPASEAADAAALMERLVEIKLPEGPGFVWIAAEAEVSRAVRAYFVDTVGHPAEWVKASAYWTKEAQE